MKWPSTLAELAFTLTICAIVILIALPLKPEGFAGGWAVVYLAVCALAAGAVAMLNLDIINRISGIGPDDSVNE